MESHNLERHLAEGLDRDALQLARAVAQLRCMTPSEALTRAAAGGDDLRGLAGTIHGAWRWRVVYAADGCALVRFADRLTVEFELVDGYYRAVPAAMPAELAVALTEAHAAVAAAPLDLWEWKVGVPLARAATPALAGLTVRRGAEVGEYSVERDGKPVFTWIPSPGQNLVRLADGCTKPEACAAFAIEPRFL